jgi:hypothetical protein
MLCMRQAMAEVISDDALRASLDKASTTSPISCATAKIAPAA